MADREAALVAAIHDIDAHARPLRIDAGGFIADGYVISIGSLHRALALTGTAPLCPSCPHDNAHYDPPPSGDSRGVD